MKRLPLVVALLTLSTASSAMALEAGEMPREAEADALLPYLEGLASLRLSPRALDLAEGELARDGVMRIAMPAPALVFSTPAVTVTSAPTPVRWQDPFTFLLLPDGALLADLAGIVRADDAALASADGAATTGGSLPDARVRDLEAGTPGTLGMSSGAPASGTTSPPLARTETASAAAVKTGAPVDGDGRVGLAVAGGMAAASLLCLLGLALYHRIRPAAALENDTRKVIFNAVCERPGLGVHDIADAANVSYSTATYHLERLVGAGMLVMTPDGNKLCYYKNGGAFNESERRLVPILKNREATRLLESILESPGTYRAALAERLGVTATTINWHLRRLREAGLIDETRQGRNAYLHPRADHLGATLRALMEKLGPDEVEAAQRLLTYAPPVSGPAPGATGVSGA